TFFDLDDNHRTFTHDCLGGTVKNGPLMSLNIDFYGCDVFESEAIERCQPDIAEDFGETGIRAGFERGSGREFLTVEYRDCKPTGSDAVRECNRVDMDVGRHGFAHLCGEPIVGLERVNETEYARRSF